MEIGRFETNAHTYRDAVVPQQRFIPPAGLTQAIGHDGLIFIWANCKSVMSSATWALLTLLSFP